MLFFITIIMINIHWYYKLFKLIYENKYLKKKLCNKLFKKLFFPFQLLTFYTTLIYFFIFNKIFSCSKIFSINFDLINEIYANN